MNYSSAELSGYRAKYSSNRNEAKRRGIAFKLSFEEWLDLWKDHIHERGPKRGQYVLCRKNDQGCYEVGNCYVARAQHNNSVRGYMDTRTNCSAYGNHIDQVRAAAKHWNPENPRADVDISAITERFIRRYRDNTPLARKLVAQGVKESLSPRYYSDQERAEAIGVSLGHVRKLARKLSWVSRLVNQ
jgi:hypothetical protein